MQKPAAPSRAATLPLDLAVLCRACSGVIPLALFVLGRAPVRQVSCPSCRRDVVLSDPW